MIRLAEFCHGAALALSFALLAVPARADLTVFAAASLRGGLDAALTEWAGPAVQVSYAGSSTLARQIEAGAPADLFIAASPDWMDYLSDQGHLMPKTRHNLLGNRLVVIAPADEGAPLELTAKAMVDRLDEHRLAVALTDAVPAGIYAREALVALDIWETVRPSLAEADNVRSALAFVARGEAALGIVYATDALAQPRVQVVARIDPSLHAPVVYPASLVDGAADGATQLLDFLQGAEAQAAFLAAGFLPPPG
ncbi:MAG: molybdate ABC transporter substrate-binding protein [Pseudomonadota bacterium]